MESQRQDMTVWKGMLARTSTQPPHDHRGTLWSYLPGVLCNHGVLEIILPVTVVRERCVNTLGLLTLQSLLREERLALFKSV